MKTILFLLVLFITAPLSATASDDWIDRVVRNGKVGNGYEHGQFPSWGNTTHPGVDIGGGCGLEVIAPAHGAVVRVVDSTDPRRFKSVGNAVVIQHSGGENPLFTTYFHLQSAPVVKIGVVSAGQLIGYTGETGAADGCHLHFEVRRFDGIDRLFHPEFRNIYLSGDQRNNVSFRKDWLNPVKWLSEQVIRADDESEAQKEVTRALNLAAGAKAAVSEYFVDSGFFPSSNRQAGLADPTALSMGPLLSIEVRPFGEIVVTFDGERVPNMAGKTIVLLLTHQDGSYRWSCRAGTLDKNYLPENCQDELTSGGRQESGATNSMDLVGTWYAPDGYNESFYFGENGSFVLTDGNKRTSGFYEVVNDRKIQIALSNKGDTQELSVGYEFEGASLILDIETGPILRLTRDSNRGSSVESTSIVSRVSEGLNLAAGAKAAVTEFYMDYRRLPKNNDEAGLARPEQIRGRYVRLVRVENGVISVVFGGSDGSVSQAIDGKSILLEPVTSSGGSVMWNCRSENIKNENLPPACRK